MAKITMKSSVSVAENFEDYILTRKAKGLADKTLTTYKQHFSAICKHLDGDKPIDKLTKTDLDEMIASMRDAGLSSNSISSYVRTMKTYLSVSVGNTSSGSPDPDRPAADQAHLFEQSDVPVPI